MVTTRRAVMLLLRKHPGSTVAELAGQLDLTNMAVRRHLDGLAADGLAEASNRTTPGAVGRPPSSWRLTSEGLEEFPRRYHEFAVDLLEDIAATCGPELLEQTLTRRTAKVARDYAQSLEGAGTLASRVQRLAELRDADGYLAESTAQPGGDVLLTENNCAVHRVARRFPILCTMELALFSRCLGPEAEVTRESHALAGDAVCCYRIRPVERKHRS